jgi:hypothetical protein
MLLIVMFGSETWRVRPSETFTFGGRRYAPPRRRRPTAASRNAGSFAYRIRDARSPAGTQ